LNRNPDGNRTPSPSVTPTETPREISTEITRASETPTSTATPVNELARYYYDGNGAMVKSVIGEIVTYYASSAYQVKTDGINLNTRKYYAFGNTTVAMRENDEALTWLLTDQINSTTVSVSEDGTLVSEIKYTAFGEVRSINGVMVTDSRYTGQREEVEIGLYYYVARFYDPELAHFIQADTIIPSPGFALSYLRYAYVNFNPILYNDPDGHDTYMWGPDGGKDGKPKEPAVKISALYSAEGSTAVISGDNSGSPTYEGPFQTEVDYGAIPNPWIAGLLIGTNIADIVKTYNDPYLFAEGMANTLPNVFISAKYQIKYISQINYTQDFLDGYCPADPLAPIIHMRSITIENYSNEIIFLKETRITLGELTELKTINYENWYGGSIAVYPGHSHELLQPESQYIYSMGSATTIKLDISVYAMFGPTNAVDNRNARLHYINMDINPGE